jgi:dolichyl-phosphate-mannose-protein mannosyltransferase
MVYLLCFKIHFTILNRSGEGDANMSSLFQANLIGIDFARNPLEIAYGSKVTIKNYGRGGALLHSHVQTYPDGSNQQQVTCYPHKDTNNDWLVYKLPGNPEPSEKDVEFVKHGDFIRLIHASTGKALHSHNVPAHVSPQHYEVSGYGAKDWNDQNDFWQIERIDASFMFY